jgi:hypothetical protein
MEMGSEGPARQKVYAATAQFSGTGACHDELMGFVFFDQTVDAVQQGRRLLHFVDDLASRLRVGLDDLLDSLRMRQMRSKCSVIQQINQEGIRKSFAKPYRFSGTSWPKNEKAVRRSFKKSFSEFFHHLSWTIIAILNFQIKMSLNYRAGNIQPQHIQNGRNSHHGAANDLSWWPYRIASSPRPLQLIALLVDHNYRRMARIFHAQCSVFLLAPTSRVI